MATHPLNGSVVLVCGGAGYIGSHACKALAAAGAIPVTFDNLSTGHRRAVLWGPLFEGDLLDPDALGRVFQAHPIASVVHFAAKSIVSESMASPGDYFRNNVVGTLNLLDSMKDAGVSRIVFSSTAAVYGNPQSSLIDESHPAQPINPYGWSKLMAERAIAEYCRAHAFAAVTLRYFNAAGADPDGMVGEAHEPETHLIPNLLSAAGKGASAEIFGDDYSTPDGSCVRDYIHVADLADAHLHALEHLRRNAGMEVVNLGTGNGSSVLEVLAMVRHVTGNALPESRRPRRPGDPPVLVAANDKARSLLAWSPTRSLRDCIVDAHAWMKRGDG